METKRAAAAGDTRPPYTAADTIGAYIMAKNTDAMVKHIAAAKPGAWIRIMDPVTPSYRAVVSPKQLLAYGPPSGPSGETMVPAVSVETLLAAAALAAASR